MNKKGSWGIVGMGVMGTSLSRNFAAHGYKLSLYNRYVKGKEEKVALKLARKYNFFDEDRSQFSINKSWWWCSY